MKEDESRKEVDVAKEDQIAGEEGRKKRVKGNENGNGQDEYE